MDIRSRILVGLGVFLCCASVASAQVTVVSGFLGSGDPTFHRPSTSFPPCNLSSSGTAVYYDFFQVDHPGGTMEITLQGSVDLLVFASYPEGLFNPSSACDDIYAVAGCFSLPVTFEPPVDSPAGLYDFVVTTCYNGDGGDYIVTASFYLFRDDFETGDNSAWSSSNGG